MENKELKKLINGMKEIRKNSLISDNEKYDDIAREIIFKLHEEEKRLKNATLYTILWIAILVVPFVLHGFISFTDLIQFGIATFLIFKARGN